MSLAQHNATAKARKLLGVPATQIAALVSVGFVQGGPGPADPYTFDLTWGVVNAETPGIDTPNLWPLAPDTAETDLKDRLSGYLGVWIGDETTDPADLVPLPGEWTNITARGSALIYAEYTPSEPWPVSVVISARENMPTLPGTVTTGQGARFVILI